LACKAAGFLLLLPLGDGTERRRMLTLLAIGMALAFVLGRQGAGTPQNQEGLVPALAEPYRGGAAGH